MYELARNYILALDGSALTGAGVRQGCLLLLSPICTGIEFVHALLASNNGYH